MDVTSQFREVKKAPLDPKFQLKCVKREKTCQKLQIKCLEAGKFHCNFLRENNAQVFLVAVSPIYIDSVFVNLFFLSKLVKNYEMALFSHKISVMSLLSLSVMFLLIYCVTADNKTSQPSYKMVSLSVLRDLTNVNFWE